MKKILLFIAVGLIAASGAHAQTYSTAIGAKFYTGAPSFGGINIRYCNTEKTALEGSVLFTSGAVGLEGLYEYQAPISGVNNLQYYVGGGGLLALGSGYYGNSTGFALRLTGGIDYKFEDAPVDVSLGLDPFFYLTPATNSYFTLGIGLRYVLK
ncbi:MAG TPA: hypothetical protein VG847_03760 [Chitinophagaceae bacterium]|nr:hypothetical protein [Chitinophagaceae bacterium]